MISTSKMANAATADEAKDLSANEENKEDTRKQEERVTSPVRKKSEKVDILLRATGDAPIMKKKKWAVDRSKKVTWVIDFIRKYIKCEPSESLFLYVNQAFAPSPDQEIGNLFECYGSDGKLVLHYCRSEAWG